MILRMVLLLLFRRKIAQAPIRDDKHCDFTMMTTTMAMTQLPRAMLAAICIPIFQHEFVFNVKPVMMNMAFFHGLSFRIPPWTSFVEFLPTKFMRQAPSLNWKPQTLNPKPSTLIQAP